ncbi:MAG TPA: YceI family protein [Gemmataceae bacterium]|nr:YceI family protein [Gemmataceae bacterium]
MVRALSAAVLAALLAAPVLAAETKYALSGDNTKVEFTGKKPDGKHDGGFKKLTGTATTDAGVLKAIEVEIDTDSLWSDADGLTKHLKNPDFFNVKENPKATFKTTKIEKAADRYTVTGDLTMLGKTKPVTFPAAVEEKDGTLTVKSEFKINRTDWGMTYGKGKVDDEVALKVNVAAKK